MNTGEVHEVHTNFIEGAWANIKDSFKHQHGVKVGTFESHICEILWKNWNKDNKFLLDLYFKELKQIYPLTTPRKYVVTKPLFDWSWQEHNEPKAKTVIIPNITNFGLSDWLIRKEPETAVSVNTLTSALSVTTSTTVVSVNTTTAVSVTADIHCRTVPAHTSSPKTIVTEQTSIRNKRQLESADRIEVDETYQPEISEIIASGPSKRNPVAKKKTGPSKAKRQPKATKTPVAKNKTKKTKETSKEVSCFLAGFEPVKSKPKKLKLYTMCTGKQTYMEEDPDFVGDN